MSHPLISRYHLHYWRGDEPPHGPDCCPGCDLGHDTCFMSYLSPKSGYTLSLVLNFANRTILGVASNDKQWFRVRGWLEVGATYPTPVA